MGDTPCPNCGTDGHVTWSYDGNSVTFRCDVCDAEVVWLGNNKVTRPGR